MNRIGRICRSLAGLPRQAKALFASAAAASAVLAAAPPLPLGHIHQPVHKAPVPVPVHTAVIGGMPGWQITLIAIGAALLTAALTVTVYRIWAAQRRAPASAASAMTASSITPSQQPEPTRSIPAWVDPA